MNSTQQYRFGRHCIALSAPAEADLPPAWARFRSEADAAVCGRITVLDGLRRTVLSREPGWIPAGPGETLGAAYCIGRRAQFAVSRAPGEPDVCLRVAEPASHDLQIGLQYAVMLLLSQRCIGLHCVTVICGSEAIALCAPSGTGKTTLAGLLVRHCEAAVVNGDFALLSAEEPRQVIFEPTPFCGSSGICFNVRLPISRIVFLSQAPVNRMTPVSTRELLQRLCSNTFTPDWDQERRNEILQTICRITERIPACTYAFAPTEDAAHEFCRQLKL